jgi:hypothetical protein
MHSWQRASLVIALVLVPLFSRGAAHGQHAIPLTPVPDVQAAAECTAEPANLDRVREIAGDAVNDPGAVLGFEAPIAGGEIVTGPDAEATITLMEQMLACINAEEIERFIGLFSDDFIKRAAYDLAVLLEDADDPEDSEPAGGTGDIEDDGAPEPVLIVGASDVYAQPDGRLTYSVSIGDMTNVNSDNIPVPLSLIQIITVEQRGDWKIDDLREQDLEDPYDQPDCGASGDEGCIASPAATGGIYVEGEGYGGWLMTADAAAEAAPWLMAIDEDAVTPFQPNEAEVTAAEAALADFIAGHPNATERLIAELNTGFYERQYLGYTTPDGAVLVINAYCGEPYADPSVDVEIVMDGGDCYWQAIYDLTEGAFINLSVNGEA